MNLQPTPSHMYLLRLDPVTTEKTLHVLENDIKPDKVPELSMQLSKTPDELQTDAGKRVTILNNKKIPKVTTKLCLNTLQQSNAQKSPLPKTAPINSNPWQTTTFNEVIPNSSNRHAINNEIELIPFNYKLSNLEQPFPADTAAKSKSDQYDDYASYLEPKDFQHNKETFNTITHNSRDVQVKIEPLKECIEPSVNKETPNSETRPIKKYAKSKKVPSKQKMQYYVHISDLKVPQRAVATLPSTLLLRRNVIIPKRTLPARIRFGPVEGIRKAITQSEAQELVSKSNAPVYLLKQDDHIIQIDVSDKDKCNWMGFLSLGDKANVWLYQENDELYAITTEVIITRSILKLGYSKKYAEDNNIPPGPPTLDLELVLAVTPKTWWCNECNRALPSAFLLQHHADVYHKDDVIVNRIRGGYQCQHCRRMFSRLYTLHRHKNKYCLKKPTEPPEKKTDQPNPALDINSMLNSEEQDKLPSYESFQNFTNGLDFSTNLFDTDRMSNLDISVNSRADGDFNPYCISFRDDTCNSHELSFPKALNTAKSAEGVADSLLDTCAYCNQVVVKKNKRKHISKCPARRLECACGRTFTNKKRLALHIYKEHPTGKDSVPTITDPNILPVELKAYSCDRCNLDFKRRGMLVNHLWRLHKVVSTAPVERPVRHYPCVACPKVYRSAAKRKVHIKAHHPGAEKLRTQSIEGGVKSCEPALCTECPRQYATRAKLLQHVRIKHPHLGAAKKHLPNSTTGAIVIKDVHTIRDPDTHAARVNLSFGFS